MGLPYSQPPDERQVKFGAIPGGFVGQREYPATKF